METQYKKIIKKMDLIDPVKYSRDRNFIDGSISKLSPYISRGVISTKIVFNYLINKGFEFTKIEKFIQELCWRDYWQLIWCEKKHLINNDLKNKQVDVENQYLSIGILNASTQINAIDNAIEDLYKYGYMHNHLRMYIASLACNVAKSHWNTPAKWMYYHLLDADWGSNALSWQWVCGANSNKKYYANQDNINKYCYTNQKNTYLDVDYSFFQNLSVPKPLLETSNPELKTDLPVNKKLHINIKLPALIYNFYNLDPQWRKDENLNRILLLEPDLFKNYPISKKSVNFMLKLSNNINGIQVFVGSFHDLKNVYNLNSIIYKEHPLNSHYIGIKDERDWMFDHKENLNSFFSYWKKCRKEYFKMKIHN
jgi:deoxyribodipyrimidine photo-lyase